MIGNLFVLAMRSMHVRMLRSTLTVLGVIIGVVFIVALLSLSDGLKTSINNMLGALGTDSIYILPGKEGTSPILAMASGIELTRGDLRTIRSFEGIREAYPIDTQSFTAEFGKETIALSVEGFEKESIDLFESQGFALVRGRWFEPGRNEMAVGSRVADGLFGKEVGVGDRIVLNGARFTVVGVLEATGSPSDDASGFVELESIKRLTGKERIVSIAARAGEGKDVDLVAERLKAKLERARGVEDFSILTNDKLVSTANGVLSVIELFLTGIASISLVVGAVGIMNTVYMSVYERTREIGIMKALGAKKNDILLIFVIESGLIGLAGGFIGMMLGFGLAKLVEFIAEMRDFGLLKASISYEFAGAVLLFSFALGAAAGFFPARSAANLKPVEALRYE